VIRLADGRVASEVRNERRVGVEEIAW